MKRAGSFVQVLQVNSYGVRLQRLEPAGEIVGRDEVGEMGPELVVGLVEVAFDGRVFERSVHPLDLAVNRHDELGVLQSC